ncbi:hypothetical protein PsorP6_005224 [Peronosclerospora sorghi]|uniref:Uncharacterized protein n=1 Tax=Peronosclerospora sorghi TaxID=230839 RepID=A0ACC0W7D3_9STRA|nr:hypothetical protein PsorP6_005224 [Peronosclerospora sorghi]
MNSKWLLCSKSRSLALEWGKSFRNASLAVEFWGVDCTWSTTNDRGEDLFLQLLTRICTKLSGNFFGKPFVELGDCLGAMVALALTHLLEQRKFAHLVTFSFQVLQDLTHGTWITSRLCCRKCRNLQVDGGIGRHRQEAAGNTT